MVFDMDLCSGKVNMFKDFEEYISIVSKFRHGEDHFLAAANFNASEKKSFTKKGNLGVNTISKYLTDACKKLGVTGEGFLNM